MVRLCWVGIMCVQKHTNNHSIIYNRPILIGIILAIIKMHDSLYKNPLSPPSRMLANKHVLYLYYLYILQAIEDLGFRKFSSHQNPWGRYTSVFTGLSRSCCMEIVYVNMNFLRSGYENLLTN